MGNRVTVVAIDEDYSCNEKCQVNVCNNRKDQ